MAGGTTLPKIASLLRQPVTPVGNKGTFAPACRSRSVSKKPGGPPTPRRRSKIHKVKVEVGTAPLTSTHTATTDNASKEEEELLLYAVGQQSSKKQPPIRYQLYLDGKLLWLELDTGAEVSILPESTWKSNFPNKPFLKSTLKLKMYTGDAIPVMGEIELNIEYRKQRVSATRFVVVSTAGPALIGRDLLKEIRFDWMQINVASTVSSLSSTLGKHKTVFQEGLGTVNPYRAKLRLRPTATPKFCKPRPIPFAIKEIVGKELDRLTRAGILEKVSHSDWASPIVTVPKKDGSYRICGDYKVTVNPLLETDQYPLPNPKDLFATLCGGQRFTKIDLAQAYQQILLDDASKELTTITTHQGLYRYSRMPFGISSAPAIFQRTMDQILQGIPNVICYIDDILVTGHTEESHSSNLSEVLERLEKHGLKAKQSKCEFMMESVEYLGHRISSQGIHPLEAKKDAILLAPQPENLPQLRSYLGLLNYYGKFIPKLATIAHPLYRLLKNDVKWNWDSDCERAFKETKESLTSADVLVHFDPKLPISLAGDASAYGIGAVISHKFPDGTEKPIAFASRSLSAAEKNYSQLEREAASLVFGIKKFH